MDTMLSATVWWTCPDCGVDVELSGFDSAGGAMTCPDCACEMAELWRWEPIAA